MARLASFLPLPSPIRTVLRQPAGSQGPDEDGSERDYSWSRELSVGSSGARRGAQAHQHQKPGPYHAVRHRQRGGHRIWHAGEHFGTNKDRARGHLCGGNFKKSNLY